MRGPTARPNNEKQPHKHNTICPQSTPPPRKNAKGVSPSSPGLVARSKTYPGTNAITPRTATRFRPSPHEPAKRKQHPSARTKNSPHPRLSDFPTFRLSDSPSQRDDSIGAHDFNRGLTPPIKTNRIPAGASSSRQGSQPVAGGS
ncbi:MAG: hypothetical protein RLZZ224_850 [Verrucomicrobiota bacterium]